MMARAFARAGAALCHGAAADIVRDMLFQSMLATGAAAAVACALAGLVARLVRAGRASALPGSR
jgi:hypothetical protein